MLIALLAGALVSATGAFAAPDCRCRADGKYFQLGDIICIGSAGHRRLAQCDMVLNNTNWTILADECPSASLRLDGPPQTPALAPSSDTPASPWKPQAPS
ncbi:hypothetical protein [Breoghania sp. L-A4]|uniref:hypothetical protein n=1 Tax=Breoghania sp. L-A4 TaxID=2304600 RepID=UPI000E35DDB9|nr:hypothetical protein [Breoghania sp. L-A4]AXS40526.1 hypothetical protein D1F64_11230 [Breoghania sp. L-A4]